MIPCGGRGEARNDFLNDHGAAAGKYYVALLIDSEESVSPVDETWIAADRLILREHFGDNLQVGALPEFDELEGVSPGMLENRLKSATQDCPEPYSKGRNSSDVLGKLNPDVLEELLPSFRRMRLVLRDKLG